MLEHYRYLIHLLFKVRSTGSIGTGNIITGGENPGSIITGGSGLTSRYCTDIEYLDGVSYSGTCRSARVGDRCYMRCTEYTSSSRPLEIVSVCSETGWSHPAPRCRAGILGSILGEIISKIIPAASDNATTVTPA